jgi:hypothetical protein
MRDPKLATRETLERLAEAAANVAANLGATRIIADEIALMKAANEYQRETTPKLRTRAEVDAEIATICRVAYGAGCIAVASGGVSMTRRVEELCSEPTAPEEP